MAGATEPFSTAGSKVYISAAAPAANTATGYAALTWAEIKHVSDLGTWGRVYNIIKFNAVGDRATLKMKGSYDDGDPVLKAAYTPGDAGQIIVAAALDDDDLYSFKVLAQDGTIKYNRALVTSAPAEFGAADNVTGTTFALAIKSGSLITVLPA